MPGINVELSSHGPCLGPSLLSAGSRRKTTAFITYAFGDRKHMNSVVGLARNLQQNGFGVALDEKENYSVTNSHQKEVNRSRYNRADFVIVCISPRYREDVNDTFENEDEIPFTTRRGTFNLHTKYLYKLMCNDYLHGLRSREEFLVVLMDGAQSEDVPHWLRNSHLYSWPTDYRNVNNHLSNPLARLTPVLFDTMEPRR